MKTKILTLFITIAYAETLLAWDYESIKINNLYYNLDATAKIAELTYNYSMDYSGNIVVPSSISYKGVTYTVTRIGDNACHYQAITSITIPNSVTSIGEQAFVSCMYLTSVIIPESVTNIGDRAFYECYDLQSINLPMNITVIGEGLFYQCEKLESVNIPENVTKIGKGAFYYCTSLQSISIPDKVKQIENIAFAGCSSLKSLLISNGLLEIGQEAFEYCSSLTSVILPNSITTIKTWAFRGCSSLQTLEIGNSVKYIKSGAFSSCSELISLTCKANNPPLCETDCFLGINVSIPLYVPSSSINAYQMAPEWKEFYNIQAMAGDALDNIRLTNLAQKVLHNGQLIIDRNGKTYNALGGIMN